MDILCNKRAWKRRFWEHDRKKIFQMPPCCTNMLTRTSMAYQKVSWSNGPQLSGSVYLKCSFSNLIVRPLKIIHLGQFCVKLQLHSFQRDRLRIIGKLMNTLTSFPASTSLIGVQQFTESVVKNVRLGYTSAEQKVSDVRKRLVLQQCQEEDMNLYAFQGETAFDISLQSLQWCSLRHIAFLIILWCQYGQSQILLKKTRSCSCGNL